MRNLKTLFFAIASLAISTQLKAQAPEIEWQNTIGGSDDDYLKSVQQTADGGYILCGSSSSGISGDKTEPYYGGDYNGGDYWVVKLNSSGDIEWQNTIGGSSDDILQSAQQTADGGYIIGGYSYSPISFDKTEANLGGYDYWVIKLGSYGDIEWQNTIGGSGLDKLNSVQQTADGGYILGGFSDSGISGDKTENAKSHSFDYWVVKLNSTGGIEWQNTIGGNKYDYLYSIQQTSDEGYILGGYSDSDISGDKTEANISELTDWWIVKLDITGEIEWQNTIGGSLGDGLMSLQKTADGGYILGGYSYSDISGDKTEGSKGESDYWVVKLDYNGNVIWDKTIGGSLYDGISSLQQTTDERYILGGTSNSDVAEHAPLVVVTV